MLDDPVFAAAFAPQSRAEVAIVADLPEIGPGARVNGRIDRLAVAGDEVLIVDFKTNRPPPAREEDVPGFMRPRWRFTAPQPQKYSRANESSARWFGPKAPP